MIFASTRKDLIKAVPRLIDDSKYVTKKMHKSLEMVSGVRLMQLLTKNTGFLLLNRFEDPYLSHTYMGAEWSEEVDRFLRYSYRYTGDNINLLQDYEENNVYEMSLLNAIDGLSTMRKGDQKRILEQFFALDSMEILVETNPELLSRTVLALIKNDEFRRIGADRIIDAFLRGCMNQLEGVGIGYLGFGAIINAITIARIADAKWFLHEINDILRYQLFNRHPRFFWSITYLYPKFVADLINLVPEIFTKAHLEFFESPFLEKEFEYARYGKVIDYIKVFRHFCQLFYKENNDKEMLPRGLHTLERVIPEFSELSKIEFSQLKIDQIDDLLWYADFIGDKHISKEIKEALQHYLNYNGYRKDNSFEKIFSIY